MPFGSGSQTSILISESLLGFKVAATRQNAGRSLYAAFGLGPRPPGKVKAPAAIGCAKVNVVSESLSEARLSQVVASAGILSTKPSTATQVDFLRSTAASSLNLAAIIAQHCGAIPRKIA